jgi:integrase
MIRRAKLYARLKEEDRYPRVAVEFHKNGRPIPPKNAKSYLIRIAGKFTDVGADLALALTRLQQEQARLSEGVRRVEAINIAPIVTSAKRRDTVSGRVRLLDAVAEYKAELLTLDKSKATALAYVNTLDSFERSYRKEFVDEIDRKDILTYIDWMRENLPVRVPGAQNRTLRNRLGYLGTFLGKHGVQLKKSGQRQAASDPGLLFRTDIPKNMKKKPKKYDQSMIETLLTNADEDQKDYLEFLLWSGFRDEEVQFLQFSDFNFRNSTVLVQAKPQFGWKPKDWEEREITLPTAVTKRLRARMDRGRQYDSGLRKAAESDLVFPNRDGRPDSHLIDRLHAVAKKAGLNLMGKRAGHMFRKTAGSRVAKIDGLPAAMEFLGHSNIETTALYLAADTSNLKKKLRSVDEIYEKHQLLTSSAP